MSERHYPFEKWEEIWRKHTLSGISMLDDFAQQLSREDIFNHQRFRRLRGRFGSQADWAALVGVSQATIGNYERNSTYPNKTTRAAILKAVEKFRERETKKLDHLAEITEGVDAAAAKQALNQSILTAALTDFQFDRDEQRIVPVPFQDASHANIEQIVAERKQLLESLASQSASLISSMGQNANTNLARLVQTFRDYEAQCSAAIPNARIMYRSGTTIGRASVNDDIAWGISEFDKLAIEGFLDDHNELMRVFYREALAKAQEVNLAPMPEGADLPKGSDFYEVASIIETACDDDGEPIFDEAIPTLIKDIAREIRETEESEILSRDVETKRVLQKRRVDAVKNGSILIGRFLIFTSFFVVFDPLVSIGVAGSIASIVGLIEQSSPGTIRTYYERLRTSMPFLPKFPSKDSR